MALKVKAKEREFKVGKYAGEYRYVMAPELYSALSQDKVIREAALRSGVSEGVMKACWDAAGEVIKAWCVEGHSVALPGIGTMRFGLSAKSVADVNDVKTSLIRTRRIWPQVFSDYYHQPTKQNDYRETRTIRDDLGCNLMGIEYSEQDWQADIAFMLQCLQFYMSLPKGERRILPPLGRIERREQMAAVGKDFKQWADNFFAEDSGNLDCKLRQVDVLSSYNLEATYQMKMGRFTQKLKEYCAFAEHIHCLNPTLITGKAKDGDRWVERDENGKLVQYYYIQSAKAAAEAAKQEPVQQELAL